jgi:hypothetical protein
MSRHCFTFNSASKPFCHRSVVDDSHCHSFITEKESEQLGSEDEAERNAAAVNIALKYTFDPLRSFYLRGNIRAKGSGPMDAVE